MFFRFRILHRIMIALLSLVTASLVFLGIWLTLISRRALENTIKSDQVQLATILAANIDSYFGEVNLQLGFIQSLEKIARPSWAQKTKILMYVIETNSDFVSIVLRNQNYEIEQKVVNQFFENHTGQKRDLDGIFDKARDSGRVQLSPVYYEKGQPCIDIIYPLATIPKKYVDVALSLEKLWNRILSIGLNKEIFVVDRGGKVVLHTEKGIAEKSASYSSVAIVAESCANPGSGFKEYKAGNNRWMVGARAFIKSLNSHIIVGEDRSAAYASIVKMKANAFAVLLLGILLSIVVAVGLAKGLSRPVWELVKGAEELSGGNFDYQVKAGTGDELAQLADAFNAMGRKIMEYQKELVKKERLSAMGEMASVVGHEIRNPLNAIKQAAYFIKLKLENIQMDVESAVRVREAINGIEQEIAASSKIIGNLLSFSRIRPPVLQPAELNPFIDGIVNSYPVPDNIRVIKEYCPEQVAVSIDCDEMRQVVLNLLTNGCQAMEKGGDLRIKTEIIRHGVLPGSNTPVAKISIMDTGYGIPQDALKNLFKPFFSTKPSGTGLGLSVVYRIVKRHNGTVEVKSRENKGTIFAIVIPV